MTVEDEGHPCRWFSRLYGSGNPQDSQIHPENRGLRGVSSCILVAHSISRNTYNRYNGEVAERMACFFASCWASSSAATVNGRTSDESFSKERIIDAVSAQDSSGSLLPSEWTQILFSITQLVASLRVCLGVLIWVAGPPNLQSIRMLKECLLK